MAYALTRLEQLQDEAAEKDIQVKYAVLPKKLKALYFAESNIAPLIAINKSQIKYISEETGIMAEELGHYHTSVGNLMTGNMDKVIIRKQEEIARRWAYKRIVALKDIINAFEFGCRSRYELADQLEVTEEFLQKAIDYYRRKYGLMTVVDDKYIIYFEPFGVLKNFYQDK